MNTTRLCVEPDDGLKFDVLKGILLWNGCKDLGVNLGEMDGRRVKVERNSGNCLVQAE